MFALPEGMTSHDGNITVENENLAGRMIPSYAGITTTVSSAIANASTDQVFISNIGDLDILIGDYLQVGGEMMRVKATVTGSNPIKVFRGVLGSKATAHALNSSIKRVRVEPIELRRHSIIRASGHTFEYVGFGPGNYSTAFPDKQDRAISVDEELLSQSAKREGGINFYTGMNDKGISYSGNKRLSTITGREEIFDTPVQSFEGEDVTQVPNLNVIEPVEAVVSRSLKVEGGPDNKVASQINGPLVVNNKVTVNSPKGLETNNIFLQGDATVSRKYTVGIATPSLAGNPGDVVYNANPAKGGYVGWIYTTDNAWRRFGSVRINEGSDDVIFDTIGIGTTGAGDCTLKVGSGTSVFCVDENGVGIGTTANAYKLSIVGGGVSVTGAVVAAAFTGDGSGLTNLSNDSLFNTVDSGIGTGIFPVNLLNVGIGTTRPDQNADLTVGAVGSSGTSLLVNGNARISGILTVSNVFVSGIVTATNFNINSSSGQITAGIVTATNLHVGTAGTIITTQVGFGSVGIGSTNPEAALDVNVHARFRSMSERVGVAAISSNEVTLDLASAMTFTLSATDDVNAFVLTNIPPESSTFTVKVMQDSTGNRSVGIDTFKDTGGNAIPVYWPGGVVPVVTVGAGKSDVYSFKTFDGGSTLYGVIGGQNFS